MQYEHCAIETEGRKAEGLFAFSAHPVFLRLDTRQTLETRNCFPNEGVFVSVLFPQRMERCDVLHLNWMWGD